MLTSALLVVLVVATAISGALMLRMVETREARMKDGVAMRLSVCNVSCALLAVREGSL